MPLIQRNLFPSKPSPKMTDGPSILRTVNNTVNGPGASNTSTLTSNATVQKKKPDREVKNVPNKMSNKEAKKMKKSMSTSLNSLLVINTPANRMLNAGGSSRSNSSNTTISHRANYDSHDSFYSSDGRQVIHINHYTVQVWVRDWDRQKQPREPTKKIETFPLGVFFYYGKGDPQSNQ